MLEQAWANFSAGLGEIRFLLEAAERATTSVADGTLVSPQGIYTRAAVVLLAAHIEAFMKAVPQDFVDQIPNCSWDKQTPGVQRYTVVQSARYVRRELRAVGTCASRDQRDKLRRAVTIAARWVKAPERMHESPTVPRMRRFYKKSGPKAVEMLLAEFSPREKRFFAWLGSRGLDRSRFWTSLEGIVTARNQIAHGGGQFSLTLAEVRSYAAVATVMVRQVRRYIEPRN